MMIGLGSGFACLHVDIQAQIDFRAGVHAQDVPHSAGTHRKRLTLRHTCCALPSTFEAGPQHLKIESVGLEN